MNATTERNVARVNAIVNAEKFYTCPGCDRLVRRLVRETGTRLSVCAECADDIEWIVTGCRFGLRDCATRKKVHPECEGSGFTLMNNEVIKSVKARRSVLPGQRLVIENVTHRRNTKDGNPRWQIDTSEGTFSTLEDDATASLIENVEDLQHASITTDPGVIAIHGHDSNGQRVTIRVRPYNVRKR